MARKIRCHLKDILSLFGNSCQDCIFTISVFIHQVLRLVERVTSSTLLEDKRDACRAIKALSKKYRLEVGAHGLDALIEVLIAQPDLETSSFVLETLCNVTSSEVFDEEGVGAPVGEQFTEIFLKKSENVISVITLLDEYDFHVRLPAIRLLMNLLNNKSVSIFNSFISRRIFLSCKSFTDRKKCRKLF